MELLWGLAALYETAVLVNVARYKWKQLFQNVGDSYHGVMSPARKGLDLDIRFLT